MYAITCSAHGNATTPTKCISSLRGEAPCANVLQAKMDAMITDEVQADEWHRVEGVNGAVVAMCERQPLNILGAAYRLRACEASQVRDSKPVSSGIATNVCDSAAYEVCPKT